MLWLVGVGINGIKGISLAALDALRKCTTIYVERFTSHLSESDICELASAIGGNILPSFVQRWFVEDGREILEHAKNSNIALVTYGDPLIATTHVELMVRAMKNSIQVQVLHSASGITSLIGETGLHMYKFGRTVTIMSDPQSAISVYNTVFDNLLSGNHTLILTEYSACRSNSGPDARKGGKEEGAQENEPFFLEPQMALMSLLKADENNRYNVFSEDTFIIIASRIGREDQALVSGKIRSLIDFDFGCGPHSIVVPGPMHFTESDAISALARNLDPPLDNAKNVQRISVQMIEKYCPKARNAVEQMRSFIRNEKAGDGPDSSKKGVYEVLDNAEYYIEDAERFLKQGKHELAVLSIGYAEGLIDALRFQKGINPWS